MLTRAVASIAAAAPRFRRRGIAAGSLPRHTYKGFISYSHAVDGELAPAVQLALHRFARPWYRLRAIRVFRDQASLSATPALWSSIVAALDGSEFFLLLASPEGAESAWVDREVAHWCDGRPRSNLFVVLTGGELAWDDAAHDFDWTRTTAMPPSARGKFEEEPRWIDLRWARTSTDLSLRNGRFREAIADLAAPLHGRPKDELIGEDVRQHRRTMLIAVTAGVFLAALSVAASAGALIAWHERGSAIRHAQVARSRELAARSVAQLSVRTPDFNRGPAESLTLALDAIDAAPTPTAEAVSVLRRSLAVPNVRFAFKAPTGDISLAFTPDGSQLMTVAADGRVTFWETATGRKTRTFTGPRVPEGAAVLSPDGTRFVTAGTHDSSRLWDTAGGKVVAELPGSVSSAPFGGRLIATTKGGVTRLFDVESGEPRGTIGTGFGASLALFSPDGTRLALVGSDDHVSSAVDIWDVESRHRLHALFRDASSSGLILAAFSPDGRRIAVASEGGAGAILGADGRSRPALIGQSDVITSLSFSPDGDRVLTVSANEQAMVWNAATGEYTSVLPLTGAGNGGAFSPNGRWIATAADDNVLAQLWDAETGAAAATLGGQESFVWDVVFSPDGRLVASRDEAGRVLVWELESSGRRIGSTPRSGGRISLGAGAGAVRVLPRKLPLTTTLAWPTAAGVVRQAITAPVYDAQSPDHVFEAGLPQDGQDLTIWVMKKNSNQIPELRHDGPVRHVAWRADSTLLATASDDGTARVWTPTGGQVSIERGHTASVTSAAFNPDGQLLVTASEDGTARVWDVTSGDQLAVFGGEPGAKPLEAAAFSPGGTLVVARAVGGSVAFYSCELCGSLDDLVLIGRSRTRTVPVKPD
jgi:WD40 repeat protein